jgi:uncharacterized protein YutE (UPF0331/DUF86 family)
MTRARERHRIDTRLERIELSSNFLTQLASEPAASVLESVERVAAMERMLEVSIQAATDVASYLIASQAWPTPETAGQAFIELARQGVIDDALAQRLRRAVGLRKVLAHDYLDIDPARLFAGLGQDMADLRAFVGAILAFQSRQDRP